MRSAIGRLPVLAFLVLVSGCRLGVSVFEGGDVVSASTERHCFEGGTCEFAVDNPFFSETFTAKPRFGYEFVKWRAGEGFLCADSTDPECTVTLDGSSIAQAIVSTGHMGYLMPEFTCTGICPERPNYTFRFLKDPIDAMDEAREAIEAYVATNGEGAPDPELYGVYLQARNSDFLRNIDILPANATLSAGTAHQFYIVANVYPLWDPTPGHPWPPEPPGPSSFALSGQTNSDNTMEWTCIPTHPDDMASYVPDGPDAIPEMLLPLECRG